MVFVTTVNCGATQFRTVEENTNTSMPELELATEYLRIKYSLRSLEMDVLISYVSKFMKSSEVFRMKIMRRQIQPKKREILPPEFLIVPDNSMKISLLVQFTLLLHLSS